MARRGTSGQHSGNASRSPGRTEPENSRTGPGSGRSDPGSGRFGPGNSQVTSGDGLLPGAIAGIAAFVAGYGLLYLVKGDEIMANFFTGLESSAASVSQFQNAGIQLPEQWTVVGMVYHTTHNAEYALSVSARGQEFTLTLGREFLSGDLLPWLIPMGVLFVAGFLVARSTGVVGSSSGAKAGATVAVGYFLAVVGTRYVFTWEASTELGSMTMSPALVSTALFSGLVYPVVFGAIGGYVAAATTQPDNRRAPVQGRR